MPETLSNLVMECVRANPAKRPEMAQVARRLEIVAYAMERAAANAALPPQPATASSARMAAV